jgi:hypothetical protein
MSKPDSYAPDLVRVHERYATAWRDHDPDAVADLHTLDTRFSSHGNGASGEGRTAMRAAVVETLVRFPEFRPEPRRVLFGADHWVFEWTLISGEVEFDCVDVVVLAAGLVETKDTYFDAAQFEETSPRPLPKA